MEKSAIIWSIVIALIANALFFILGWILGKKTNFQIRQLWHYNNLRKARALYRGGDIEKSFDEYSHIIDILDGDWWLKEVDFVNLIEIHKNYPNVTECISYIKKLINRKFKISLKLREDLSVLFLNNGYVSEALEILLYGETGGDSVWHSILAWAYSQNKDCVRAIKEAKSALKKSDRNELDNVNRCGNAFNECGFIKEAHQCYKKCLASEDSTTIMWAFHNIGIICNRKENECSRKQDFKNKKRFCNASYNFYKKAYKILIEEKIWEKTLDPSNVLTSLISKTENIEEKTDYIEKALEIAPYSVYLHSNIAWMYYNLGDYKNALRNAKKCYELNPNEILSLNVLAASYLKNAKYQETIKIVFEAWKKKQDIKGGYLDGYVAVSYENLDKPSEALKHYKIAIAKGFNNIRNYEYYYTKAINLSNWLCDYKTSIPLCFEAITILPENEKLKELLGKSLKMSGETEIYNFNPFQNI